MRVLNTSLRIIFDDTSVDGMFKVTRERNLIQLYVEESPPISEYSSNGAHTYGLKESSSMAQSHFEAHTEAHVEEGPNTEVSQMKPILKKAWKLFNCTHFLMMVEVRKT